MNEFNYTECKPDHVSDISRTHVWYTRRQRKQYYSKSHYCLVIVHKHEALYAHYKYNMDPDKPWYDDIGSIALDCITDKQ